MYWKGRYWLVVLNDGYQTVIEAETLEELYKRSDSPVMFAIRIDDDVVTKIRQSNCNY